MTRKAPSARKLAVRTLRSIEQRNGFSNRLLGEQLERHPELSRADRGLTTALVYGVLRQRAWLDHCIDAVASKPAGIKGELRALLRVAAFELLELRKPAAIVGAETVKVARSFDHQGRLRGLITAIVANIDRRQDELAQAIEAAPPLDQLQVRHALPRWLARRWLDELGEQTALARAAAVGGIPSVDLRVDLGRIEREEVMRRLVEDHPGIELEAPTDHPATLRARGGGDIFFGPLHESGLISVQALGSQRAGVVLAPQPGERVWDACAGMGTKTVQLAELMQRRGTLWATDPSRARLEDLELARTRAELDVDTLDLQVSALELGHGELGAIRDTEPFDAILVDAPCTGLGNLARHPELRWTANPSDIRACAKLQAAILADAASALAPGGRLVYAVCSLEPEEGRDLVRSQAPALGLRIEHEEQWTPEAQQTDGFFLARLLA